MHKAASAAHEAPAIAPLFEFTLNVGRPLAKELVAQLNALCDQAEDAGVGTIVRINLDGHTVAASLAPIDVNLVNHWERALRRLERLPGVTIAVANGDVGGLGLALLLCADFRLICGATHLRLSHPGQPQLPGMVLHRLSNQLGVVMTRRMALLDHHLCSQEALSHGLVDKVCTKPNEAVQTFLQDLQHQDLTQVPMQRRLILDATSVSYEDALGSHLAACDRVLRQAAGS